MTHPDDRQPLLGREEKEFVDRLAAHYAPMAMTPAKRAAFDQTLQTRLERPRRSRVLIPAIATAAVAAALWIAFFVSTRPTLSGGEDDSTPAVAGAWEYELFLSSEVSPSDGRDDVEMLPDDYQAIASAFLGG